MRLHGQAWTLSQLIAEFHLLERAPALVPHVLVQRRRDGAWGTVREEAGFYHSFQSDGRDRLKATVAGHEADLVLVDEIVGFDANEFVPLRA